MKKGQVSLFIIVGVIIGIIIGVYFGLTNDKESSEVGTNEDYLQAKSLLEDCLKSTSGDAINNLGYQGMLHDLPAETGIITHVPLIGEDYKMDIELAPYYILDNVSYFPSLEKIQSELSYRISEEFPKCTEAIFEGTGMDSDLHYTKISVLFTYRDIIVKHEGSIDIRNEEETITFQEINTKIDFNFIEIYDIIDNFINYQMADLEYFQLGYLTDLGYKNDFTFQTRYMEGDIIKVDLFFDKTKSIMGKEFTYSFLLGFDWEGIQNE